MAQWHSHPPSFCVAGVAGDAAHFAWQAWHNHTSTTWHGHWVACLDWLGRPWTPVTPRHFAWQAWHLVTSTFVLRGRRGTISHPPSFCVAGVALMALGGVLGLAWSPVTPVTPRHFAWQAWHLVTSTFVLRGRRGTNSHPPVVLRGRRGTHGTGWRAWTGLVARDARDAAALCVAGVAQLGDIHLRFAWQAWHNLTVSQSNIHLRFAWQAWHSWHWVACLDWLGRP